MSSILMRIDTTKVHPGHMPDLLRMAAFPGVNMIECKTCKRVNCSKSRIETVGPTEEEFTHRINGCTDWSNK